MGTQVRRIMIIAAVGASLLGALAIFLFRAAGEDTVATPEYTVETIDILSIKRTEGEIQFIEQLSEEEFESLVNALWKYVFSDEGELDNTTAITLEFSLLLDHELGLQIDQNQRVALIAAHRQMMIRKHGYGTTTGPVTTPEGIEEIYSEFEEKVEQILNDPDLVDQLLN